MWPKWTVRRPIPIPRSGSPQRLLMLTEISSESPRGEATADRPWPLLERDEGLLLRLHGNAAAALALAGVLAGAAGVAGLAAALALAVVVRPCSRAWPTVAQPPLPLHEFFPAQPPSPVLQPPLPLHEFMPLQTCFSLASALAIFGRELGAGHHAGHDGAHDLREFSSFHAFSLLREGRRRPPAGGRPTEPRSTVKASTAYPPSGPCQGDVRPTSPRGPRAYARSQASRMSFRGPGGRSSPDCRIRPGEARSLGSPMNPDLERLVQLQRAETELKRVEAELAEIPRQKAHLEAGLDRGAGPPRRRPGGPRDLPEGPPPARRRAAGPRDQAVQVQGPAHGREDQQGIHGDAPRDREPWSARSGPARTRSWPRWRRPRPWPPRSSARRRRSRRWRPVTATRGGPSTLAPKP